MLLQVMEAGSYLDEALDEDTFSADEPAPDVLPLFVRKEVLAAIERHPPLLKLVRTVRHGVAELCVTTFRDSGRVGF